MATTVTLKPNAIDLSGSTSGTTTLQATAVAGTTTVTLPAATDTLVGKATTDTLTNKTLTTPVISTISNTGTLTLPTSTDTLVGRATTDTLTNKTLTSPTLTTPALGTPASGVMTNVTGINYDGYKNRIINGAMVIDQRNAGASVAITSADQYVVDRFNGGVFGSGTGRFSLQQSSTVPAGFTNSLLATVTTADASPSASYAYSIIQYIEGYNIADLGWGTANAQSATLSFWVRSSVTGTFPVIFQNSAADKAYGGQYTISSANTWEQKSIVVSGVTSGTWLTTNGIGIRTIFGLGAGSSRTISAGLQTVGGAITQTNVTGSTQLIATNGATFYITGVQLEKGSTATSFDYRPYGTELQLCQRYCYAIRAAEAVGTYSTFQQIAAYNSTALSGNFIPKITMRVVPTLSTTGTASNYAVFNGTFFTLNSVPVISNDSTPSSFTVDSTVGSGLTVGQSYRLIANNNNTAYLIFSAEL
jgi:hypothetical protein